MVYLVLLGFVIGILGTIIGVGGGFLLMPALILLYPAMPANEITSISIIAVFLNSLSGSVAYARLRRIDYRSGRYFILASLPGIIAGSLLTSVVPRHLFNTIFGVFLCAAALLLFFNVLKKEPVLSEGRGAVSRVVTDIAGRQYTYSYNGAAGLILCFVTGFISGLLGIGGGIMNVPGFILLLNMPVHIATATSQYLLAATSFLNTSIHIMHHDLANVWSLPLMIAPGIIAGAQAGAYYSQKLSGAAVTRGVALALILAALKIILL